MKFVPVLLFSSLAILPLGAPAQPDRAASTWLVAPSNGQPVDAPNDGPALSVENSDGSGGGRHR
jgi:hypothetical protein